jgi:hypothetical protein
VNCLATWETAKLLQIKLFLSLVARSCDFQLGQFYQSRVTLWISQSFSRAHLICVYMTSPMNHSQTHMTLHHFLALHSTSCEKQKHQNVCIIDYRECPKPSHSWIYRISSSLLWVTLFKLKYVYIRAINECDKSERDSEWSEWSGEIKAVTAAKWNKNELLISLFDFYFHCEFIHLASLGEWKERTKKKLFLVLKKGDKTHTRRNSSKQHQQAYMFQSFQISFNRHAQLKRSSHQNEILSHRLRHLSEL